jgi:hypothetical protein
MEGPVMRLQELPLTGTNAERLEPCCGPKEHSGAIAADKWMSFTLLRSTVIDVRLKEASSKCPLRREQRELFEIQSRQQMEQRKWMAANCAPVALHELGSLASAWAKPITADDIMRTMRWLANHIPDLTAT